MSEPDTGWVAGFTEPLRVRPGSKVALRKDFDPGERFGVARKKNGDRLLRCPAAGPCGPGISTGPQGAWSLPACGPGPRSADAT